MDAKIVIYSRHPQEIRQQKSSAPAFSAAAGRKLKKQDNNLFRTIQNACGQNAQVLPSNSSWHDWANHKPHSAPLSAGAYRDDFIIVVLLPYPSTSPPLDVGIPSHAQDAPPSFHCTNPVASSGRSHASQWASSATSSSYPSWNDTSCR